MEGSWTRPAGARSVRCSVMSFLPKGSRTYDDWGACDSSCSSVYWRLSSRIGLRCSGSGASERLGKVQVNSPR